MMLGRRESGREEGGMKREKQTLFLDTNDPQFRKQCLLEDSLARLFPECRKVFH